MSAITLSKYLLFAGTMTLLASGCATHDVNPSQPRANTGYIDFQPEPPGNYCWEVSRFDDSSQKFKTVYSKLKYPENGVLRLAFIPGNHRIRITFLDRVVTAPAEISVEVDDGKITPVRVTLTEAAIASVETRQDSWGGRAKGRYGRRREFSFGEAIQYSLSATVEAPGPYKPKNAAKINYQ